MARTTNLFYKANLWGVTQSNLWILRDHQGRIKGGQRGQLPRALRCKGAPRDEINVFQVKYTRLKNFCGSEAIQEYNSILYFYVALSIRVPQQQLISLQV